MLQPETLTRLAVLRSKARNGETLTDAELAEAITLLRGDRQAATVATAAKPTRAKALPKMGAAPVDFSDLDDL